MAHDTLVRMVRDLVGFPASWGKRIGRDGMNVDGHGRNDRLVETLVGILGKDKVITDLAER